jgi:UDP-N-acetylmuramate dehydrogenase
MKDVVTGVTALDESGELHELDPEALQFGYRRSALQQRAWTVAETEMHLQPGDPEQIQAKMADLTFQRESKQPLEFPSAGSVFKRPPGRFVGPMVEALGLKGYRIGDAQISEKHAGFIINRGNALARDVLALIDHVRERVKATYDVWLETEVRIIGEDEAPAQAADLAAIMRRDQESASGARSASGVAAETASGAAAAASSTAARIRRPAS